MMFGDNGDDLENEEMNGLQSYARKGMAQEMAKKLGLLGDVPGAATDDATGDEQGDGTGETQMQNDGPDALGDGGDGGSIDPKLLEQILAQLAKGQ